VQQEVPQQVPPLEHAPASAQGIGLHPPLQYVPCGHLVPHAPQWSGLLSGLTHAPSQQTRPAPHAGAQAPPDPPELPLLPEPPLDVAPPELPLPELVEDPEPPPAPLEPLELPLDDDDMIAPSSPALSMEASVDPPELKVEPPHAPAMRRAATSGPESTSAFFIECPSNRRMTIL
jgi:hypothetical protein